MNFLLVLCCICLVVSIKNFNKFNLMLFICTFIINVMFLIYCICKEHYSKKMLPAKCIFNPFGYLELHIGKTNKSNKVVFYRLCAKGILEAKKLNKDILIDTWAINPKEMEARFKNSFEIKKISLFQWLANFENILMHNRKNWQTAKCFRYVVYTNKLSKDQVDYLNKRCKRYV